MTQKVGAIGRSGERNESLTRNDLGTRKELGTRITRTKNFLFLYGWPV